LVDALRARLAGAAVTPMLESLARIGGLLVVTVPAAIGLLPARHRRVTRPPRPNDPGDTTTRSETTQLAALATAREPTAVTRASSDEPAVTATADVVIVGAGPTGLTLAARLHQFGASVRIVDRQLDRVHESRALAMQPRTIEVLRGLGIAETLVERGNDAVQLRIHFDKRIVSMRLFDIGLEDTAYPFLLFISQAETEAILNEHLAARGLPVERGVELVGFSSDSDEVACTLRRADGGMEQVRCRYLVGCDGAHSTVREGAGIPFEGGTYPQTFVLADLEVDGELEHGAAHSFLGGEGILLFFPLGTPATWRIVGMRPSIEKAGDRDQATEPLTLAELQRICDRFTGGTLRLRDPV
jgi:2-polyprenyl-6-methoxyphenol hydroxylase-like FAD-dependent oxidoreductase